MIPADRALARRLEGADALAAARFARALARLRPGTASIAEEVAGGYAVYAGIGSPLTRAVALGMSVPVREADLDRVEAFFRARGVTAVIEVCPLADASLREMLGARGYRLVEFDNVLIRKMARGGPPPPLPDGLSIARADPDDAALRAGSLAGGLLARGGAPSALLGVIETLDGTPEAVPFLARLEGRIAGVALIAIDRGLARMSGTATLPEFRGRGVRRALLQARISFAASEGCDLATVGALPGSVAQRNLERHAFRVAYTRAKMALDHRGGSEMLLQY